MRKLQLKLLMATTCFALVSAIFSAEDANAQVANISRTDLDFVNGLTIGTSTTMQSAVSQTYFDNDGRTAVIIKNNTGAPVTANIISSFLSYFVERLGMVSLSNQAITIPSASTVMFGPFGTERWNNANNTVQVSFTTIAGVSVTAVRLPKQ
ncbi:hypothetical protein [Bradyrhizobium diazoefficiens]